LPRKNKGRRKPQPAQTVFVPSLPDPASSPIPLAGTIEFEHGQIVAKMGGRKRDNEWMISNQAPIHFAALDAGQPARLVGLRPWL
jgi:hypothetical protein